MITTKRLFLRRWKGSDREPFSRLNADPRVMEFFSSPLSHKQSDALIDRIQDHFRQHGFGLFATELRQNKTFIGFIGLSIPNFRAPFMTCVEIGWRLLPAYWNQGIATEGARAVLRYAFETLHLEEVASFTVPINIPSRRVMMKIGLIHNPSEDFDLWFAKTRTDRRIKNLRQCPATILV